MGCTSSNNVRSETPHLVIVGFQFAGYNLLQQVKEHFRVTVIDKKDFFEWSTATPHSIAKEGNFEEKSHSYHQAINVDKVFGKNVKFVQGLVEELVDEHTISIKSTKGKTASSLASATSKSMRFDYIALCTGHVWGINSSPEKAYNIFSAKERSSFLSNYREELEKAESVLVVGGGPTGVETVGEILEKYDGKKKVGLVTNSAELLEQYPEEIRNEAQSRFEERGVDLHFKTRFSETSSLAQDFDYVINCVGVKVLTPFMDKNYKDFKNERGGIFVNKYYQVTNRNPLGGSATAATRTLRNVFCFGDAAVTSLNEPKNIPALVFASLVVSHNLLQLAEGNGESEFKTVPEQNFFISAVYFDHGKGAVAMGDQVTINPNMFSDKAGYEPPFFSTLRNEADGAKNYAGYLGMFKQ